MPKSLRHSCRSELHVLPRFPAAQTIRSPDRSELRARSVSRSGPASYEAFRLHPGISPPSRYGDRDLPGLTLGIARGALLTPVGFHRFELEVRTGSLPPRAVSSTRQGISLDLVAPRSVGAGHFCRPLHVAMQSGLSLRADFGESVRLALSL